MILLGKSFSMLNNFCYELQMKMFLHKSYIYFKPFQFWHKFNLIWIWHEGVMHFRSWGKPLVQWYWPKMTYNIFTWHMHFQVEFALPPNIKVEVDILNFILKLVNISSHKNWASYGLGKLTSKLGFRQNDL